MNKRYLLYLYTLSFYLILPFVLLRLNWRAFKNPAYGQRWGERFGYFSPPPPGQYLWVHAVSLGEVLAAIPLIKQLQTTYAQYPIVVTTTTPTGSARVQASLGNSVFHVYVPYDIPRAIQRFIQRINPQILILIETELWPNLIAECEQRNIPVFVANARLSEYAAKNYQRFSWLTRPMLQAITYVAAHAAQDTERFIRLGLPKERITVTGSIKFDIDIPSDLSTKAQALRKQWGERPVWIAASTHAGEDEKVLDAFAEIRNTMPNLLLLLVPRHPERFNPVADLCRNKRWNIYRRSQGGEYPPSLDIYLGDTLGELLLLYACADVAFVGGSLQAIGGHNPLEPGALGLAVIVGPYTFNFSEIVARLTAADALIQIDAPEALAATVLSLLQDTEKRQRYGRNAQTFIANNRGSIAKHIQLLKGFIK